MVIVVSGLHAAGLEIPQSVGSNPGSGRVEGENVLEPKSGSGVEHEDAKTRRSVCDLKAAQSESTDPRIENDAISTHNSLYFSFAPSRLRCSIVVFDFIGCGWFAVCSGSHPQARPVSFIMRRQSENRITSPRTVSVGQAVCMRYSPNG